MTSFRNRYRAFLSHFIVSILIAGAILLIAKFIWYPSELMVASGAIKIFLLVILVDAGLGPLLTLIVYNPNKSQKELRTDLSLIILLQLCALVYGSYTLFGGRPVYYVFAVDRFELVQANDIPEAFLRDEEAGKYGDLPKTGLQWVYSKLPEDVNERNDVLFNQMEYGADLAQTPKYYQPLEQGAQAIRERLRSLDDLLQSNTEERVDNAIQSLSLLNASDLSSVNSDYGYLPLSAKKKDLTIILSKSSLDVVGVVDLYPWREGE